MKLKYFYNIFCNNHFIYATPLLHIMIYMIYKICKILGFFPNVGIALRILAITVVTAPAEQHFSKLK